jgi:hypothetical protein
VPLAAKEMCSPCPQLYFPCSVGVGGCLPRIIFPIYWKTINNEGASNERETQLSLLLHALVIYFFYPEFSIYFPFSLSAFFILFPLDNQEDKKKKRHAYPWREYQIFLCSSNEEIMGHGHV